MQSSKLPTWEYIIEESLSRLNMFLREGNWYGRENEVINLFAHHFLMAHVGEGPFLDPSQIGIEVAVKQIPKVGRKKLVRKDLVLWNEPFGTVWEGIVPKNSPAAILEWKVGRIAECDADIKWLLNYTNIYPQVLGYSICVFTKNKGGFWFKKVIGGRAEDL